MTKKTYFIIKLLVCIIALLFSSLIIVVLHDLNVLPGKYFSLIVLSLLIINLINVLLLLVHRKAINIIGFIITTIIVIMSCLVVKHISRINAFFDNAFNNNTVEITGYNMISLKDSNYKTIEDLDRQAIGYIIIGGDDDDIKLVESIKNDMFAEFKEYTTPVLLYEDLVNNKIDAILISEGIFQLLEDQYKDINEKTIIVEHYEIKTEIINNSDDAVKLRPVNILISGSDSRSSEISATTRSDVNMIVTINPSAHKILLTSIPRDYYVQLHGTTGYKDKLTHAGLYGINMSKTTIEDLFSIDIDYTIKVGFQAVVDVVDLIGGVDIDSDLEFTTLCGDGGAIKTHVVKGMNHFNGGQALSYARERYAYSTGDNHRIQNQQQVLMAIINKVSSDKSLLKKYDKLLETFSSLYRTDIPSEYIKLIVKEQINNMTPWKVERQVVTGSGSSGETYSFPGLNLWIMIPDMDSVDIATIKILKNINGE